MRAAPVEMVEPTVGATKAATKASMEVSSKAVTKTAQLHRMRGATPQGGIREKDITSGALTLRASAERRSARNTSMQGFMEGRGAVPGALLSRQKENKKKRGGTEFVIPLLLYCHQNVNNHCFLLGIELVTNNHVPKVWG